MAWYGQHPPLSSYIEYRMSIASMSVPQLLEQRTLIDTQICLKTGGAVAGLTVGKKLNKNGKPKIERKGKPTCNGDFTKKICAEQKEAVAEFKKANPDQKGAHLVFVSNYKKEHKDEYEAFEATWKEEHPNDDVGSVSDGPSESAKSDKPKRVISPEHLAKMQAGREAAKAKKDAEKANGTANDTATVATAVASEPAAKPKKAVKKVAKKEPIVEPVAVISSNTSSNTSVAEEDEPEMLPFKHNNTTYIRLGNKREDGTFLWATGDLWASKKGAKGAYVGCLQDDGSIDADAQEPILE